MKAYVIILAVFLLVPLSYAATITGTVYDYDLSPVAGAVVQINTVPPQTVVAVDGTYRITVSQGDYVLIVSKKSSTGLVEQAQANITVSDDGMYTYDLILFEELQEIETPQLGEVEQKNTGVVIIVSLGLALIIVGSLLLSRKKKSKKHDDSEDELKDQILKIIKKEKRITQKELRKHFPVAEATISLAISHLEHQGEVEKIKKGRGNIIVLKKEKK